MMLSLPYIGDVKVVLHGEPDVTVEEKRAWIELVVSAIGYVAYVVVVAGRTGGGALQDAPYVVPMLATVGAAIGIGIVLNIVVAIRAPKDSSLKDERDLQIGRFGDHVGQAFVVIGGLSAMILAMTEAPYFWIANAVYLCFFLSAVVGSIAKIAAYRWGLQ
jgi:hypothetical protein